jgi:NADH:ubiquinone oxidoreductase subunit 6 (subunit J)
MKGLSLVSLMEIVMLFVAVIMMLPTINSVINGATPYMDSSQVIAAGLIGLVMIVAVFSKFFQRDAPQYYQNYG